MSLAPHLTPGAETRAVQIALIRQGYDCGRVDGRPGPKTHMALERWANVHQVSLSDAPSAVRIVNDSVRAGMLVAEGRYLRAPDGVTVRNWLAEGVERLRDTGPRTRCSQIVIHESVTRGGWRRVWDVLTRRHLGVHLIVARDGSVTQHVDLQHSTVHAGALNRRSIGIEVESAYYSDGSGEPGVDWIPAIWAHRGRYLLPIREQCESTWLLVERLCAATPEGTTSHRDHVWPPLRFPGLVGNVFLWGRVEGGAKMAGVQAHARTAHSDGLFPECYCALRLRGLSAIESWRLTVELAGSGQRTTALPAIGSGVG